MDCSEQEWWTHVMHCLTPVYVHGMAVPCNHCVACRSRKQNEWAFRMQVESVDYSPDELAFVTLTLDSEHVPVTDDGLMTLDKSQLQLFFKRFRKFGDVRYFACGEYGDRFERPHYHAILYSHYLGSLPVQSRKEFVEYVWQNGLVDYQVPSYPAMKYVAKYTTKSLLDRYEFVQPPFAVMSRKPAIGASFLERHSFDEFVSLRSFTVQDGQGCVYPLPRYYKEKMAPTSPLLRTPRKDGSVYYRHNPLYDPDNAVARGLITSEVLESARRRDECNALSYPYFWCNRERQRSMDLFNFNRNLPSYEF